MVLIGDTWQWTPFMFIVLLAAIENQPRDQVEAAQLDGASGWQIFRDITWPAIAPVAATVVLIRLIEAFKIIDLPNVLTGGGPGLATESMTLHSFIAWRTQDLGGSAAVGYMLLFVSTVTCVSFFNFVVRPARRYRGMSDAPPTVRSRDACSSRAHRRAGAGRRRSSTYALLLALDAGRAVPALLGARSPRSRSRSRSTTGRSTCPSSTSSRRSTPGTSCCSRTTRWGPISTRSSWRWSSTVLAVLIGSLAAYALVRIRFQVKLAAVGVFLLLLVAVIVAVATFGVPWQVAVGVAVVLFLLALWH